MHTTVPIIPWYRHRWPWLLMLGPAIVVVAGSITGWLAYTRQDAMVVDDYYKKGKAINQDLRRERAASAMGLSFRAHYDGALLTGSIAQAQGPHRLPFRIHLAHATQPEKDLVLGVVPGPEGRFTVALPMLAAGRWQLVVEGAARDWRLAAGWRWPAQAALAIEADPAAAP